MSTIDSSAEFLKRLSDLSLEAYCNSVTAEGWCSFANFAFATYYIPGQADDDG